MNELAVARDGWRARLELEVLRAGDRSLLGARRHEGPLRVQRAFYPEGADCPHVYVLHPPGGLVGGDELELALSARAGSAALFTTPAAQKLYRSAALASRQRTRLDVERDARLEWLPGENIVFDRARAEQSTTVALAESAAFLGWELTCFGRPASNVAFTAGQLVQSFEIWRGELPLVIERSRVDGGGAVLDELWGYAGLAAFGTLYAVPPRPRGFVAGRTNEGLAALVEPVRAALTATTAARFAATALDEAIVVRAGDSSAERVRAALLAAWETLRPAVLGRAPVRPRIWAT